jgi:hypothetical protein
VIPKALTQDLTIVTERSDSSSPVVEAANRLTDEKPLKVIARFSNYTYFQANQALTLSGERSGSVDLKPALPV